MSICLLHMRLDLKNSLIVMLDFCVIPRSKAKGLKWMFSMVNWW